MSDLHIQAYAAVLAHSPCLAQRQSDALLFRCSGHELNHAAGSSSETASDLMGWASNALVEVATDANRGRVDAAKSGLKDATAAENAAVLQQDNARVVTMVADPSKRVNYYQTPQTLSIANNLLRQCNEGDMACGMQALSTIKGADTILDKGFNECVANNNTACVQSHLNNIKASDASPEMQEALSQLRRLGLTSVGYTTVTNDTLNLSPKSQELVQQMRQGQDVGCISGVNTNCIGPMPYKTAADFIESLTARQLFAVLGYENDPITGEGIGRNEIQDARALGLLNFIPAAKAGSQAASALEAKLGSAASTFIDDLSKVKKESTFLDSTTAAGDIV